MSWTSTSRYASETSFGFNFLSILFLFVYSIIIIIIFYYFYPISTDIFSPDPSDCLYLTITNSFYWIPCLVTINSQNYPNQIT